MPCYNSAKGVANVIKQIPKGNVNKIIACDDGSTDDTAKILKKFRNVILVQHKKNSGYGAAQKTLYKTAEKLGYNITVILHSDGQHDPKEIPFVVKPLLEGKADVVLGARTNKLKGGMPFYKLLGNIFLTGLENLAFGMKLSTFHSGFRAATIRAVKKLDYSKFTNDFHFDSQFMLYSFRAGLKIQEVPIRTIYGEEKSGVNVVFYGFNILGMVFSQVFYRLGTHFRRKK